MSHFNVCLGSDTKVFNLLHRAKTNEKNETKSSADPDKPMRSILKSQKVTKHSSIWYVRYGFLLLFYSNSSH